MRVVIKIGTSTLTHSTGNLNIRRVEELCKVMSDIKNAGHEVILVSSGAIGMGVGKLGLLERPTDVPTKQAAAAVLEIALGWSGVNTGVAHFAHVGGMLWGLALLYYWRKRGKIWF